VLSDEAVAEAQGMEAEEAVMPDPYYMTSMTAAAAAAPGADGGFDELDLLFPVDGQPPRRSSAPPRQHHWEVDTGVVEDDDFDFALSTDRVGGTSAKRPRAGACPANDWE
jgi:hypothetical protein